jgi:hypothetical protein
MININFNELVSDFNISKVSNILNKYLFKFINLRFSYLFIFNLLI